MRRYKNICHNANRTKYTPTDKYWSRNIRTGEVKCFDHFYDMQKWYRNSSILGLMEWAGWHYDTGYVKYLNCINERMF